MNLFILIASQNIFHLTFIWEEEENNFLFWKLFNEVIQMKLRFLNENWNLSFFKRTFFYEETMFQIRK